MIGGLLAKGSPSPSQFLKLYTLPLTESFVNMDIKCINLSSSPIKVRIAITNNSTVGLVDHIEYDAEVVGNGELVRSCVMMGGGESVFVYSDSGNVVFRLMGAEPRVQTNVVWTNSTDNKTCNIKITDSVSLTGVYQTSAQYDVNGVMVYILRDALLGLTDNSGSLPGTIFFNPSAGAVTETVWTYVGGNTVDVKSFTLNPDGTITQI